MSDPNFASPKLQEFLTLLPITCAIAGLPTAEHGKYFNDDQMEIRARSLKSAYRQARYLVKELAQETA